MNNFEIFNNLKNFILTPRLSISYLVYLFLVISIVVVVGIIKNRDKKNIF